MKKFTKVKMVKTPIGVQYLVEWFYELHGQRYLADWAILNSLKW